VQFGPKIYLKIMNKNIDMINKMEYYKTIIGDIMKKQYLFIIFYILVILSCSTIKNNNVLNNPYKNMENYNGNISLSVKNKIISPNKFVIDGINQMDSTDAYSGYELTEAEKNVFMEYYNLLPEKYKDIINNKVFAIYFINNFKGSGMTDCVFDKNNNAYIILYLNRELLNKTISEWIEFRDNSPFIDNANIDIEVDFNTNYLALIFGLLHETSHIYDFYYNITPYTDPYLMNIYDIEYSKSFTKDIWDDFKKQKSIYNIFCDHEISFYDLGNRLDKELSMEFYKRLVNSPFSSLYGSTTWSEDFAETFTYYYLNKFLETRYEIKIYKNNELNMIYSPTDNPLIIERYKLFNDIL
jgi:hypothetical protein